MVFTPRCDVWQYFDNLIEEGIAACKLCKQRMKNDRSSALRKHLRKLHNAKSEVWNYFDNVADEGVAVCKRCKQRVRNNHSSFLTQHMEKAHNILIYDIEEDPQKKRRKSITSMIQVNNAVNYTDDDCTQWSGNDLGTTIEHNKDLAQTSSYKLVTNVINIADNTQMPSHSEIHSTKHALPIVNSKQQPQTIRAEENLVQSINGNEWSSYPLENNICIRTIIPQETQPTLYMQNSDPKYETPDTQSKRTNNLLCIEMDEKTLISAVWGLMIDDGITPALFSSRNMQSILQPICEAISVNENKEFKIDEAESERILCLVANKIRNDLSNDLDCRLLSLKIDMDFNTTTNSYCVSSRFVQDGIIKTHILGVIDLMDDPQLTEQHIKQILHKFNIDSNQIINVSWDITKTNYNLYVENSDYLKEIEKFEKYPDIQLGDIKLQRYVGVIAQLCLLDIFKNPSIFEPFLECRNLAKFISDESNGFAEIFELNNLSIPELDSPWKWCSTYEMMHALHKARTILKGIKFPKLENQQEQFNVTDDLWLFIEAFIKSISFLQKTITKYYNEEMHFGEFYAQWLKTKLLTTKLSKAQNENGYITTISVELLKCIETRSKEILDLDYFHACLYLDPRFHHTVVDQEKSKAVEYLKKLWNRLKIYNVEVTNAATEPQHFDNDEDAFLNEFLCQDAHQSDGKSEEVYNKIESLKLPFKSVDTDVLSFWDNHKSSDAEIYSLSAICFALPITQNYCQQRYTNIYQSVNNSKMSTFTRQNLLTVRLNSHLLGDALKIEGIINGAKKADDRIHEVEIISCNDD